MSTLNKLIIIAALGYGIHWWSNRDTAAAQAITPSVNGFIPVVMPAGIPDGSVMILAPLNCPSDAAQRADRLAEKLDEAGIPNVRKQSFSANIPNPTDEDKAAMERSVSILNGEIPAVFVNGMGKSNPTAEDIIAEYNRIAK